MPAKKQADVAVDIALGRVVLWQDLDGGGWATIPHAEHVEHWQVRSKRFRRWLSKAYREAQGTTIGAQALHEAVGVIEALADDRPAYPVATRTAECHGWYLDLADADWRCIGIRARSWHVGCASPVKFRRARGMKPLPVPVRDGSVAELRPFLNVGSDEDYCLMVAWMLAALRPGVPYPVLVLHGEAGSSKSTTARVLRALTDPSTTPLRSAPRDLRDLMIAATNSGIVAFDNLSNIPGWLSDALCCLSTGGGFATRELYSDDEERIFDATRPVLLNGITELATRGDLADRAIVIDLPSIAEDRRRTEEDFWEAFDRAAPSIFGGMLDALSRVREILPAVKLRRLPRMADFARFGVAVEQALDWPPGAFMDAYQRNRACANTLTLEASLVGPLLLDLVGWSGTPTELLTKLTSLGERNQIVSAPGWPKSTKALHNVISRVAPNLRMAGVEVEYRRTTGNRSRTVDIRQVGGTSGASDAPTIEADGHQPPPLGETEWSHLLENAS